MQSQSDQVNPSSSTGTAEINQSVEARDQIDGAKDDLRALIGAADLMEESDFEFTNPKQGFRAVQVLAQAALDKLVGASGMLDELVDAKPRNLSAVSVLPARDAGNGAGRLSPDELDSAVQDVHGMISTAAAMALSEPEISNGTIYVLESALRRIREEIIPTTMAGCRSSQRG